MTRNFIFIVLTVCGSGLLSGCQSTQPLNFLAGVAQSHIEENAPAKSEFEKILKRDLESYFKRATRKAVTVQHEFLRDGPTQSGVSYPKYYLWVKIYDRKRLIDEGAVRAAAMEQKQFEITDYLSRNAMRNGPEQIDTVFPQPVGDRIRGCIK